MDGKNDSAKGVPRNLQRYLRCSRLSHLLPSTGESSLQFPATPSSRNLVCSMQGARAGRLCEMSQSACAPALCISTSVLPSAKSPTKALATQDVQTERRTKTTEERKGEPVSGAQDL